MSEVKNFVYKKIDIACEEAFNYFCCMDRKRSDVIADELESMILEGVFSDGQRLDEVQIADRFNVSRTPIREAFHRLGQTGLVEQLPRRGVFVRQPGPVELIEMFEVMAELEAACVSFASTRISTDALRDLHHTNELCDTAVAEGDTETYFRENERFHALLYQQSGNSFLEQECYRLHRRLQPYRRMQLRLRGRLRQSMAEHKAIVNALEQGDGPKAADVIRAHVAVQGEKFHHLIASLKSAAE